jgi:O-antigen ligase
MRRIRSLVLPALVAVVIIGWSLSGPIVTRLSGQERLEINSIQLRLTYTDQAFELMRQHWIGGVGIGQYTMAVYEEIDHTWPGYVYQPVHNLFLLIFTELGAVGASIFCMMLVALAYHLRFVPNDLGKVTVIASGAGVLVISLFDHYSWTHYSGVMMLWLVMGLAIGFLRQNPSKKVGE